MKSRRRADATVPVRASLDEQRAGMRALADEVRAALDGYLVAVDAALLAQLSVPTAPTASRTPLEAERRLRAAVSALSERGSSTRVVAAAIESENTMDVAPPSSRPVSERGPISRPDGPASSRRIRDEWLLEFASESRITTRSRHVDIAPAPTSEPDSRLRPPGSELDADGAALQAEFESIDFDGLSDADFASYAAELAARARHRQECGLAISGHELEVRIIRRLTALAHQRNLARPIHGLSRSHRGDWPALAKRAREERERRASAALRAERMAGYSSSSRVPVSTRGADPVELDDDSPLEVPRLVARAKLAGVAVVGGVVKHEKLAWLRRSTGIAVEWIALDAGRSAAAVTELAARIRNGRLAALVLLNGLMDHKQSEPLTAAARDAGVPVAYADKAGKGSLARAFLEIERRVGDVRR